jgi:hypothetical protein
MENWTHSHMYNDHALKYPLGNLIDLYYKQLSIFSKNCVNLNNFFEITT